MMLSDFLNDEPKMKHQLTVDGNAFVIGYLTDIFEELNKLNKQLQEQNKLLDAETKFFELG